MIELARRTPIEVSRDRAARFDVICAGEALWTVAPSSPRRTAGARGRLGLRPGGGAVNTALALAEAGLRVGLAAALADDAPGRALVARVNAAGVDTGGVSFAARGSELVLVESEGTVHYRDDEPAFMVPEAWSAPVLLLSGLSPSLARAAALCKAARAARRAGAMVVVDVNARWRAWAGHDPRAIRAPLREADVVRSSSGDLAALGVDPATLRAAMRPGATLVMTQGAGLAAATGQFGEIALAPPAARRPPAAGAGDAFTAAICAELARTGDLGGDRADLWTRVLQRGHAAARARAGSRG